MINVVHKSLSSVSIRYEVAAGGSGSYINSVNLALREIKRLVAEGHEIHWNSNGRFCVVAGKTFNIDKRVYDKRINIEVS